jgi:hypothetical protein
MDRSAKDFARAGMDAEMTDQFRCVAMRNTAMSVVSADFA